jgi:hypothetical protein
VCVGSDLLYLQRERKSVLKLFDDPIRFQFAYGIV